MTRLLGLVASALSPPPPYGELQAAIDEELRQHVESPEAGSRRWAALLVALAALVVIAWLASRKNPKLGGRVCPFCGAYNALDERRCLRCERRLPPSFLDPMLRSPVIVELWATKLLAGISIVVFALQMGAAGPSQLGWLTGMPASVLLRFGALTGQLDAVEPWRALSACFVHLGPLHIAMNVLALAELGRVGEKDVGGPRLVLAYVITGVAGFVASAWWYSPGGYTTAGASGAVFGLDGLFIASMAMKGDRRWKTMLVRTVIHSFIFYFMLQGGTNQAAHIGGLCAGLGLGVLYARESRPWQRATLVNLVALLSLVAITASLVLPHYSVAWKRQAAFERVMKRLQAEHGGPGRGAE